jgi:2-oxoglutarate dehydrogenase E1 component
MDKFSFLNAAHTGYIADLYDKYLQNPDIVEPSWRSFFKAMTWPMKISL